jgi:hypothetical protein
MTGGYHEGAASFARAEGAQPAAWRRS